MKTLHQLQLCLTFLYNMIAYTLVHDGRKKTPMHVSTAQSIHEVSRSKTIIQVLNRLGLCMSYDELEHQDNSLDSRTRARADGHSVALPPVINSSGPIHGAMDNFVDHEEDTTSGIGGNIRRLILFTIAASLILLVYVAMRWPPSQKTKVLGTNYLQSTGSAGRYWCMWYKGRLGNLMFQYASVLGLSKAHNKTIPLPENDILYTNFELQSAIVVKKFSICESFVPLIEEKCCTYDQRLTNVTSDVNYTFRYYLQSWKYFMHVEEEVRREFTFRRLVREKAMAIVEQARKSYPDDSVNATVVGIHIRTGDFLNNDVLVKLGYQAANKTYIHHAMDYFISKYKHVVFVVCSNDLNYSKDALEYKNSSATFQTFSPIDDISTLSACDHMIMTVGTFGWWAGFLSGGTVVYYKKPFKEGTYMFNQLTMEDYYLPSWIALE